MEIRGAVGLLRCEAVVRENYFRAPDDAGLGFERL